MVTQSSLQKDAGELLQPYFEEREKLVKQIEIFKEALDTAREDLKALDSKYKKLKKQAGLHKTNIQKAKEFVKENEGVLRRDLAKSFSKKFPHLKYACDILYKLEYSEKFFTTDKDGRIVINNYKVVKNNHTDVIMETLNKKPSTATELKKAALERGIVNIHTFLCCLNVLKRRGTIFSTATYKNQTGALYYLPNNPPK